MFLKQKKFAFSLLFCIDIVNFTFVAKGDSNNLIQVSFNFQKFDQLFRGINKWVF